MADRGHEEMRTGSLTIQPLKPTWWFTPERFEASHVQWLSRWWHGDTMLRRTDKAR